MRLIKLLILGAGAAYLYQRFVAGPQKGREETQHAQPFSSEQLQEDAAPVASGPADPPADTLTQPTWLKPADA